LGDAVSTNQQLRAVLNQWRTVLPKPTPTAVGQLLVLHTAVGDDVSGIDLVEGAPATTSVTVSGTTASLPASLVDGRNVRSGFSAPSAYESDWFGTPITAGRLIGFDLQVEVLVDELQLEFVNSLTRTITVWAGNTHTNLAEILVATPSASTSYQLTVNHSARFWAVSSVDGVFSNPLKVSLIAA
jgi:hypothetical protein